MDTEAVVRDYYAAFNEPGRRLRMLDCLHDDVVHEVSQGGREVGRDAFAAFMTHMDHCYEERIEDLIVMVDKTGTRAAAEFTVHGRYLATDTGVPAGTSPARGQTYVIPAGAFLTIRNGKISRVATHYNLGEWVRAVA